MIVIPEAAISGYPGPTEAAAPWVPALPRIKSGGGRDDIIFLIQSERKPLYMI